MGNRTTYLPADSLSLICLSCIPFELTMMSDNLLDKVLPCFILLLQVDPPILSLRGGAAGSFDLPRLRVVAWNRPIWTIQKDAIWSMSSNNNHAERNREEWLPPISIIGQLQSNKPISDNETDRFMIADFSQFIYYSLNPRRSLSRKNISKTIFCYRSFFFIYFKDYSFIEILEVVICLLFQNNSVSKKLNLVAELKSRKTHIGGRKCFKKQSDKKCF